MYLKNTLGAAQVAQQFSATFSQGPDPEDWDGVRPQAPCMEPDPPSASLRLSLSLLRVNKIFKKKILWGLGIRYIVPFPFYMITVKFVNVVECIISLSFFIAVQYSNEKYVTVY